MSFPCFDNANNTFSQLLYEYFNVGNLIMNLGINKTIVLDIGIDHNIKTSNVNLDVVSKLNIDKYKIEFIKKFSSTNILNVECHVNDLLMTNSGHSFIMTNDFSVGHRQARMINFKKSDNYHAGMDFNFISDKPIISTHGLFGYRHFFTGGKVDVDTHEKNVRLSGVNFCVGYSISDFTFHGLVSHAKGMHYEASIFSKISDSLQLGALFEMDGPLNKSRNVSDTKVSLCGHLTLDPENGTFLKFKTTNCGTFAIAYGFNFGKDMILAICGEYAKSNVEFGLTSSIEFD